MIKQMNNSEYMEQIINFATKIGICIVFIIVGKVLTKILTKIVLKSIKFNNKLSQRKKQTLSTVATSFIKYSVWFVIICTVLSILGINISSLIALAGVGSIVVGLGAQSIVQDIITGMFILFEDQFGIGDIITVDRYTGTVENIGLRSTKIRNINGDLHIIPNGTIKIITNMSKEFNRATVNVGISYDENVDKVIEIVEDEMERIYHGKQIYGLIDIPKVLGIVSFGDSCVNLQILADTEVGENWNVEREIRRFLKKRFDKENINIPYPMRTVEIVKKEKSR